MVTLLLRTAIGNTCIANPQDINTAADPCGEKAVAAIDADEDVRRNFWKAQKMDMANNLYMANKLSQPIMLLWHLQHPYCAKHLVMVLDKIAKTDGLRLTEEEEKRWAETLLEGRLREEAEQ